MKKFKQNPLLNVELKATPLTQNAEGKLLGGFVGLQGSSSVSAAANNGCNNYSCKNKTCMNNYCQNPADCSDSGVNEHCTNGTTATVTVIPTKTNTTTSTYAPELFLF
jgi:hypothetical protein